jgi:hypothetical protein
MTWLSASAVQRFSPRAMLHEIQHALKLIGLLNINSESGSLVSNIVEFKNMFSLRLPLRSQI